MFLLESSFRRDKGCWPWPRGPRWRICGMIRVDKKKTVNCRIWLLISILVQLDSLLAFTELFSFSTWHANDTISKYVCCWIKFIIICTTWWLAINLQSFNVVFDIDFHPKSVLINFDNRSRTCTCIWGPRVVQYFAKRLLKLHRKVYDKLMSQKHETCANHRKAAEK